jgi:large subunit ribosomal protein L28
MARRCDLTGKRPNVGNKVSHSNIKTKKRQLPNLQMRKIWWEEENRFVTLKISTRALRTLRKKTLGQFLADEGLAFAV